MNTSFQIVKLIKSNLTAEFDPITMKQKHDNTINQTLSLFERSILKALHVINTESQIISFSEMNDFSLDEDLRFHKLNQHEQISILYLLYLQYNGKDWDEFWEYIPKEKRVAIANYRDQFIVLGI